MVPRHTESTLRVCSGFVEAKDAREALEGAALQMPPEIVGEVDLVEVRVAPDPDTRSYIEK